MPLYEMILITRPGHSNITTKLLKHIAHKAQPLGINVRNCNVLGDRVMSQTIRTKDFEVLSVGRYLQILVDAAPQKLTKFHKLIRDDPDALRIHFHKIKDFF